MQRYFCFIYNDETFYDDTEVMDSLSFFVDEDYFGHTYGGYNLAVF